MADDRRLLTALRVTHRLGMRQYREELRHLDLTPRQAAVLLAIETNPGHGVRFVAQQIGSDLPTCSALVARLEERALIERRPDPDDRRRTKLFAAEAARPLIDVMLTAQAAAERRMAAAAGDDADLLRALLDRLAARLAEAEEPVEA